MVRVGAGVEVLGEQFLALQVGLDAALDGVEAVGAHALVDLAPPDVGGDRGLVDDELVLDGAAGVDAGFDHEGAVDGQPALVAAQRLGHQGGRGLVGVNRTGGVHSGPGQRVGGDVSSRRACSRSRASRSVSCPSQRRCQYSAHASGCHRRQPCSR